LVLERAKQGDPLALSMRETNRVQGVEDSRIQVKVNYYKSFKGLKLFQKSYELCLEI
jgi:hypothetical protein